MGLLQSCGQFNEDRSQLFAMSAPRSVELNEQIWIILQNLREVAFAESKHPVRFGRRPPEDQQHCQNQDLEHLKLLTIRSSEYTNVSITVRRDGDRTKGRYFKVRNKSQSSQKYGSKIEAIKARSSQKEDYDFDAVPMFSPYPCPLYGSLVQVEPIIKIIMPHEYKSSFRFSTLTPFTADEYRKAKHINNHILENPESFDFREPVDWQGIQHTTQP
jgi:hypothetical protein